MIYRQIKAQWYNILLQKKMDGEDISKLVNSMKFEEEINGTLQSIIARYEESKVKVKEKKNKNHDNMYQ